MDNPNRINVMVVRNCMNMPKYTLIGYIYLSNGEWRKIVWINNDISLTNTIVNFGIFQVEGTWE